MLLDRKELEARVDTCALCEERSESHCSVCGCPIERKAPWRSSYCDRGYWPLLEAEPAEETSAEAGDDGTEEVAEDTAAEDDGGEPEDEENEDE